MEQRRDDYEWSAQAYAAKAAELKEKEKALDLRFGSPRAHRSEEMDALWDAFNKWVETTLRDEFMKARGYKDMDVVHFDVKTNKPNPDELQKAREAAACLLIADSISRHEQKHGDLRRAGGGRYERPSQGALEEEADYADGMAFIEQGLTSQKKKCPERDYTSQKRGRDPGVKRPHHRWDIIS